MKNVVLIAFLALSAVSASAQRYKTAAGIRVDRGVNFTLQQYLGNSWTAEGILHAPLLSDDIGLTVLAEKHQKILFRGINIYGGGGFHYYGQSNASRMEDTVVDNVFGLSLIGGAELSVGRINISVDLKPELHLSGDQVHPFDWNGAAVSVRYIIAKRDRKKIKDWKIFNGKKG